MDQPQAEFFIRDREYRIAQVKAERRQNCLGAALNLKAVMQLRIQRSGLNSDGVPFTGYSDQYAKKREAEGYQNKKVDFTVTGRMWASITAFVVRDLEGTTEIVIKAGNDTEQTKLNAPLTRPIKAPRGNILKPTKKEAEFIANQYFELNKKYL
jgi:hypothetical protein